MRLPALISITISLTLSSFNTFAVMVGLCPATPPFGMIPCDAACTGSSAANMASQLATSELSMATEFNNLNQQWVDAGNSDTDLISSYIVSKQTNSQSRLTAYDGVEAKVSNALALADKKDSVLAGSLELSLELISKNEKLQALQLYKLHHSGAGDDLTHIPSMLSKSLIMSDPINGKGFTSMLIGEWASKVNELTESEVNTVILTEDNITLSSLAFDQSKLSLGVSNEVIKLLAFHYLQRNYNQSLTTKKRYVKNMLAIDLLLSSYDVDPTVIDNATPTDIARNWFVSSESQKNISNQKPRDLNVDLAIAQGLENTLLNDYLSLKKGKNLVRALN